MIEFVCLFDYSACYSSLKSWESAIEDASTCITKDPSFIKGYYRLATAYTEIGNYDDAISVLQTALTKDPGNYSDYPYYPYCNYYPPSCNYSNCLTGRDFCFCAVVFLERTRRSCFCN